MRGLSGSFGQGVFGALISLCLGFMCASPAPAFAIEYAADQTPLAEPFSDTLESRFFPSNGVDAAIPLEATGKWNVGFDRYAPRSFAETDSRETQLVLNRGETWLMGARAQISGNDLFFVDDKLSLSVGVPLQTTAGRVGVLNNIFVQRKRDMRIRDLVLSLVNEKLWSVAAAHKLPIAYKPLNFGYGIYAQFRGSELRHVGLGFSGRLRF